tara:strand:+ start:114 stop:593 length:480 start_codon:yes stop_codon:yes gene_type:complete
MKIEENSKHRFEKGNTLGAVDIDRLADRQFSFSVLWRGIQKRCPKCGVGEVLTGYLKPALRCSHCSEDFSHISADDGPAWLTLLIVGHAIVPLMLVFGRDNAIPAWFSITSLTLITLVGIYLILPRAKGAFIALIWVTGATGEDMFANDQESQDHPTDR